MHTVVIILHPPPHSLHTFQPEVTVRSDRHTRSLAQPAHTITIPARPLPLIVRTAPPASTARVRATRPPPEVVTPATIVLAAPVAPPKTLWRPATIQPLGPASSSHVYLEHTTTRRVTYIEGRGKGVLTSVSLAQNTSIGVFLGDVMAQVIGS